MEAVRVRLGSVVEWAVAALFLVASVGVASLAMRELRAAASVNAPAPAFTAAAPAGLTERAVSVQHLLSRRARKCASAPRSADVVAALGRAAETGEERSDVGPLGERVTRFYDYGGTRFALVFEPVRRRSRASPLSTSSTPPEFCLAAGPSALHWAHRRAATVHLPRSPVRHGLCTSTSAPASCACLARLRWHARSSRPAVACVAPEPRATATEACSGVIRRVATGCASVPCCSPLSEPDCASSVAAAKPRAAEAAPAPCPAGRGDRRRSPQVGLPSLRAVPLQAPSKPRRDQQCRRRPLRSGGAHPRFYDFSAPGCRALEDPTSRAHDEAARRVTASIWRSSPISLRADAPRHYAAIAAGVYRGPGRRRGRRDARSPSSRPGCTSRRH